MEHQNLESANLAQELAQTLHEVIQHMPANQREAAQKRVGELLLLAPDQDIKSDILTCLEPGFQNMQARGKP